MREFIQVCIVYLFLNARKISCLFLFGWNLCLTDEMYKVNQEKVYRIVDTCSRVVVVWRRLSSFRPTMVQMSVKNNTGSIREFRVNIYYLTFTFHCLFSDTPTILPFLFFTVGLQSTHTGCTFWLHLERRNTCFVPLFSRWSCPVRNQRRVDSVSYGAQFGCLVSVEIKILSEKGEWKNNSPFFGVWTVKRLIQNVMVVCKIVNKFI